MYVAICMYVFAIHIQDFASLYSIISSRNPQKRSSELHTMVKILNESLTTVKSNTQATKWVELFLSIGEYCDGYQTSNITPYIHIMVYHIPYFIGKYKNISQFTCQGIASYHAMYIYI